MPPADIQSSLLRAGLACLLAGALLATGTGCKTTVKSTVRTLETAVVADPGTSAAGLSELELQQKLAAFYVAFVNAVELATEKSAMQTEDLNLRRKLIDGRIRAVRACRQVVFERPPMAAFVDTWSLCIQFREYLEQPGTKEYFGEAQPELIVAADKLGADIKDLGRLFLKSNELAAVEMNLQGFAHTHPFSASQELALASQEKNGGIPEFGWLLNIPLSPFRAFQGVDQTAAAVHEFNFVAAGFAQTARDLPQELSWQLELRLVQTRQELQATLDEFDRKQTNTQATLQQVRDALRDTNRSLESVQNLASHVTRLILFLFVMFFAGLLAARFIWLWLYRNHQAAIKKGVKHEK